MIRRAGPLTLVLILTAGCGGEAAAPSTRPGGDPPQVLNLTAGERYFCETLVRGMGNTYRGLEDIARGGAGPGGFDTFAAALPKTIQEVETQLRGSQTREFVAALEVISELGAPILDAHLTGGREADFDADGLAKAFARTAKVCEAANISVSWI
ncbi:hypothetical protein [Actinokineospora sp.]|uniref:hypothetical protein n=1 Tax=Actinokineospora sp. TaxID=1872133 RepID=UPI004037A3CA